MHHIDLATITLAKGAHRRPEEGMCVMEAVAYFSGETHGDRPQCVSPVIGDFLRSWNDSLPDADRTRLLVPYIPLVVGTRTTDADEQTRAWLATDWLVRTFAAAWLRLAGLTDHADALAGMESITGADLARKAMPVIADARKASAVAGDAAWDVAWDAAWAAAWDAAWDVAGAAAGDAAWDAAGDAAWDAAGDAAGDALRPTVVALQASACDLLDRMIAVGRVEVAS